MDFFFSYLVQPITEKESKDNIQIKQNLRSSRKKNLGLSYAILKRIDLCDVKIRKYLTPLFRIGVNIFSAMWRFHDVTVFI